ncbi:MAG: hypothetical protein ACKON9_11360, partial [Planctomycetaceae bacterium]
LRLRGGREPERFETVIRVSDIECAGVGGATPKLRAAEAAGIRGVALHSENQTDADAFQASHPAARCRPAITDTFEQLYRYLIRGFQIDRLVAADARTLLDHWEQARSQDAALAGEHRLDVFVKPRVSVRIAIATTDSGHSQKKWRRLPTGVQTLLHRFFVPWDQWLVITEDAGGGKT